MTTNHFINHLRCCHRLYLETVSRQSRSDSLSILSRQSDFRTHVGRVAAILTLVLSVGVGSAWGVTVKDTIAIVCFGSTSGTSYTGSTKGATNKGVEAYIGNFIPNTGQMKVNQGSTSATNGSNFFAYNSKAMPGYITKVELVITSGSTTASYCRLGTSKTAAVSSNVTWANSTASSLSSSIHSWTLNESDSVKFFRINWAKNGGTVKASYVVITYVYHTVTYSGNGNTAGSAPTDATKYLYNQTVTVQSKPATLAKSGYTFGGWNTNSSGTGTNYTAGSGTFKITSDVTLHAKWTAAAACDAPNAPTNSSFFVTNHHSPVTFLLYLVIYITSMFVSVCFLSANSRTMLFD